MKLLLCTDLRLGAACTENLGLTLSRKWQASRTEKFADLVDQAAQNNAEYIALLGQMFGQKRTSETVIDSLCQAVKENQHIHVLAFLAADEFHRISYRNDLPENLHLICTQTSDSFLDRHIALRVEKGDIQLQLSDNSPVWIRTDAEGRFILSGMGDERRIASFEPIGFEDAQNIQAGYSVLEWTEEELTGYHVVGDQKYAFVSVELKILPEDGQEDIFRKVNAAVKQIGFDTFLRVTITGRSAFGLTLNSSALKNRLQNRIFFVEIYDNTVMDIDEDAFENDISLRSEFVRLALQDDSLSESERSRIISCGWNALSGKEVPAE